MLSNEQRRLRRSWSDAVISFDEFYFQWHITDRCNLRCGHCYQTGYSRSSELTLEEIKKVATHIDCALSAWRLDGRVAVTGGEPFMREDLFDILSFLEKQKYVKKIGILSNGTLIRDAQSLKKLKKLHYVQLSLEGRREVNDEIRGKGVFDKVIESTGLLKESGIPVRWMITLHKKNAAEVPDIIDLAVANNVDTLTFERFIPMGSGKSFAEHVLSPAELEKAFTYIVRRSDEELSKGSPLAVLKLRTLWVLCDPQRAEIPSAPFEKLIGASCSVGMDSLCILPDATVLPCRRLPIPIGNLKEESVLKIWVTSKLLRELRNKNNLKGKCHGCEFIPRCGGCRATAYAVTGDYFAEDPQCWKKKALYKPTIAKDCPSTFRTGCLGG